MDKDASRYAREARLFGEDRIPRASSGASGQGERGTDSFPFLFPFSVMISDNFEVWRSEVTGVNTISDSIR